MTIRMKRFGTERVFRLTILSISLFSAAIIALTGCTGAAKNTVSGTGTIRFNDLEGGFYGILTDDGKKYDPNNLGQEFQKDGIRIRFEAKIRTDLASIHMWGTIIELTRIEPLP
ncbi:MAG: hypothetical protein HY529_04415 [Chloroflexi bacterium]|nr:hypothetical protein [Chloroflexota bacterium]